MNLKISNIREGNSHVLGERELEKRVLNITQGQPQVVNIREGKSVEISRTVYLENANGI